MRTWFESRTGFCSANAPGGRRMPRKRMPDARVTIGGPIVSVVEKELQDNVSVEVDDDGCLQPASAPCPCERATSDEKTNPAAPLSSWFRT